MQVFESLEEIPEYFGPTSGERGQLRREFTGRIRRLIDAVCRRAKELDARLVLVIFDPHPARILRPHGGPALITPMPRKMGVLAECGLDVVVIFPSPGICH